MWLQRKTLNSKNVLHKKVLLRERKRHTARHVASTPYVVLTGYPPWQGTPLPWQGTPPAGYPPGRVPPLLAGPGRVPPGGCPMAFWEMLQSIMGYGYPPCGQTEGQTRVKTLPSRRTTYASGNKWIKPIWDLD